MSRGKQLKISRGFVVRWKSFTTSCPAAEIGGFWPDTDPTPRAGENEGKMKTLDVSQTCQA